jgi:hypothetical protein
MAEHILDLAVAEAGTFDAGRASAGSRNQGFSTGATGFIVGHDDTI